MKADKNVFPYELDEGNGYVTVCEGLNVRDYIAIQAMTGLLANPGMAFPNGECVAKLAYETADAMIKQSEVPHE